MFRLSFRNLFQNKARLLISVGGVALALMLMLALDAIFTGAEQQLAAYIERGGADVFVSQAGVRNLHMSASWMPPTVTAQVQAVDGVDTATPIMYLTANVEAGKGRYVAYIFGLPPDPAVGRPWQIYQGVAVPAEGEVVIDRGAAAQAGLHLGDKVQILGLDLKIAGLSEGTASITNSTAFITMADFERAIGGNQAVSFVLVKVKAGQSPDAVAARIAAAVSGVTVQTRSDFAAGERRLVTDMSGDVLNIMNLVGFVVGLAVMALTVYIATLARRSEYGVLKAVGARSRDLFGTVLMQALYSVGLGLALGLAFTLLLSALLTALGSNVLMEISGGSVVRVAFASLLIAALASLLPIVQIARVDPAQVFRRKMQ
jgi:putative ABC transport system permease protein